MLRYLNPRNDWAFKQLFGTEKHKHILIGFLNDILHEGKRKILDVEFLPLDQDTEIAALRQSIVDVSCKLDSGERCIVEMQCAIDTSFIKRAVTYACRAYINQRKKKTSYSDMKPVIFIAILDGKLFPEKKEYLSHHKISDVMTGEVDIEELSFSFLELGKMDKSLNELSNMTERWIYFFRHAESIMPDELEFIRNKSSVIGYACDALSMAGYTPEQLEEYEKFEMKEDEIATRISDASIKSHAKGKREGLKEGREKGIKEGRKEGIKESQKVIAYNMRSDGLPNAVISKYLGITESELEKIFGAE